MPRVYILFMERYIDLPPESSEEGLKNIDKSFENELDSYQAMEWNELEKDPVAGPIFQQMAYDLSKQYHERDGFTGEVDNDGRLISKDGKKPFFKPSMILGAADLVEAGELTKEALRKQKAA